MSEEERRRKIILDSAAAMIHQIECMRNTMLLTNSSGGVNALNENHVNRFLDAVGVVTDEASEIQRRCAGE